MPHHFTKSTVEASCWCLTCHKMTPWRVFDGRRQYCLTCHDKPAEPAKPAPAEQLNFFRKEGA